MNCGRGKSGEKGCYQFLDSTWRLFSKEIIGYVAPQTEGNEEYVAIGKVQNWLNDGYSAHQIALMWNQGHAGKCSRGVNKHGVEYDSCGYAVAVMAYYHE